MSIETLLLDLRERVMAMELAVNVLVMQSQNETVPGWIIDQAKGTARDNIVNQVSPDVSVQRG